MTNISPDALISDPRVVLQCDTGSVSLSALSSQIDAKWLTQALSENHPGVVVESAAIVRVVAGCSAKICMDLSFNEAGRAAGLPCTMIVKAGFNRHDPIMLFTYDIEMRAYRDLLPRHPINAPRCFFAGASPDAQSAALILEDLTARNVRFCHAQSPLTRPECAAFLRALAIFHASSWNDRELAHSAWAIGVQQAQAGLGDYFNALLEPASWAMFTSLPRGAAMPRMLHDRARFMEGFARLHSRGATEQQVALMGDEHLGNLYIEPDGTPGFLDFQSRMAPWSQGTAYFMGGALDVLDRRAWERDLLRLYLDTLAAHGAAPPSFDDAWNAYCRQMLFGFFIWLTNGSQFQSESVNTANAARFATAVIDHDSFGRLGL